MMLAALALGTAASVSAGYRMHDFQLSRFDGAPLRSSRDNTKPPDTMHTLVLPKAARL
jgi:hypothetical protein